MRFKLFRNSIVLSCLFLMACQSVDLLKRRYSTGYYFSPAKSKHQQVKPDNSASATLTVHPDAQTKITSIEPTHEKPFSSNVVSNKRCITQPASQSRVRRNTSVASTYKAQSQRKISFPGTSVKMNQSKLVNHDTNNNAVPLDEEGMFVLLLILSLLVPPLAIYIKNKKIDKWFWVALVCCLLAGGIFFNAGLLGTAWIVAFIIALLVVLEILP